MAPHNIYPAAGSDQWIAIACRDDINWLSFRAVLDEEWAYNDALLSLEGRLGSEDAIDERIAVWTGQRDRFDMARQFREAGVASAVVARPEDRIDCDPTTAAWGLWPAVDHPEMGVIRVDGLPIHLSRTDWEISRPAPLLGQHNEHVFGDILGMSSEDIRTLAREGVL